MARVGPQAAAKETAGLISIENLRNGRIGQSAPTRRVRTTGRDLSANHRPMLSKYDRAAGPEERRTARRVARLKNYFFLPPPVSVRGSRGKMLAAVSKSVLVFSLSWL